MKIDPYELTEIIWEVVKTIEDEKLRKQIYIDMIYAIFEIQERE